jgi:hypothetical protein
MMKIVHTVRSKRLVIATQVKIEVPLKLAKPNLGSPSIMSTMCGVMEHIK